MKLWSVRHGVTAGLAFSGSRTTLSPLLLDTPSTSDDDMRWLLGVLALGVNGEGMEKSCRLGEIPMEVLCSRVCDVACMFEKKVGMGTRREDVYTRKRGSRRDVVS